MPVMNRFPVSAALSLVAVTMSAQSPTPTDGPEANSLPDKVARNWRVVRDEAERVTA